MKKKILIGVAWPYVNGNLHIGHLAGYLLPADICARYNRIIGNDVLMVSGSDCFGTPITVEADKRKLSPSEVVEEYHKKDVALFKDILKLTYDLYTKTSTDQHISVVQDFFVRLLENGYIFIDKSQQYFSETDNRFLPDRYVVGECPFCGFKDARSDQCDNCGRVLTQGELINPVSNISKTPVSLKDTSHYFLDWPKLQPDILKFVTEKSGLWKEWVRAETLGWLNEGLKPRAITRDIDWGVPVPVDRIPSDMIIDGVENKRIYVWFDAVIGYFSASKLWAEMENKDWKPFWNDKDAVHYYFMGKDNLIFHTIFWPGQLIGYDRSLHLPDIVSINMFFDLEGKKFSKSRGVVLDIKDMVEKYGNDRLRFYITLVMPENKDSSFSWQEFKEKNNGILVATLGNFIHRTLSVGYKADFVADSTDNILLEVVDTLAAAFDKSRHYLDKCEYRNYLETVLQLASAGNKICDTEEIWNLQQKDPARFNVVMTSLYSIVGSLGLLFEPLMPEASEKLFKMIYASNSNGLQAPSLWPVQVNSSYLKQIASFKLQSKPEPLFQKIEEIGL